MLLHSLLGLVVHLPSMVGGEEGGGEGLRGGKDMGGIVHWWVGEGRVGRGKEWGRLEREDGRFESEEGRLEKVEWTGE